MEHFNIIQALCRAALSNPTDAMVRQVERLRDELKKSGAKKEAKVLAELLTSTSSAGEMAPSRIQKSFIIGGEELTPQTPIPVDKESSTPLVQIIFSQNLPVAPPLFDDSVKYAIESVLIEWKNYEKLTNIHAQPSRSCLIYGAPGTGKTHLAMWIAKQIGTPVVLARLDGLMSSLLGTTSRNIGTLFAFTAKYKCVLLLDEFDAIAKLRDDPQEVGEIKRVVNTLLQSLDARAKNGFTIGITNHEKLLDPAIWRRFDVQIEIPRPSPKVMEHVLSKFLEPLKFKEPELHFLAWIIEGSSGADAELLAKWLKKVFVLDRGNSLVENVRRFALLNAARINTSKKDLLLDTDEVLATALLADHNYPLAQKEVAELLGWSASNLSKRLSKNK